MIADYKHDALLRSQNQAVKAERDKMRSNFERNNGCPLRHGLRVADVTSDRRPHRAVDLLKWFGAGFALALVLFMWSSSEAWG